MFKIPKNTTLNKDETIKERKLVTQPFDFAVADLVTKMKDEDINIPEKLQRNYVWNVGGDETKPSRLIESLILNIPIPILYFAENDALKYDVIDGQQRLKSFKRFIEDEFKLSGLDIRQDLNEKKFSELEDEDKNKIRKRAIRAIVILNESNPEVRFEVFERLNTGMVELSAQDIRHAIYTGNFNDLLIELGKTVQELFKFSTKKDEKVKSAEELVLRFFAFYAQAEHNENDFGTDDNNIKLYLNRFMKENRELQKEDIEAYRQIFLSTIDKITTYLGESAFKRPKDDGKSWEQKNNRNIFDFLMLAFALEKNVKLNPKEFLSEYENYFRQENSGLKKGLGYTNKTNLQNKVNIIRQILRGELWHD